MGLFVQNKIDSESKYLTTIPAVSKAEKLLSQGRTRKYIKFKFIYSVAKNKKNKVTVYVV